MEASRALGTLRFAQPTKLNCINHCNAQWIPAYAGMTQYYHGERAQQPWIPAYAGMTQYYHEERAQQPWIPPSPQNSPPSFPRCPPSFPQNSPPPFPHRSPRHYPAKSVLKQHENTSHSNHYERFRYPKHGTHSELISMLSDEPISQ